MDWFDKFIQNLMLAVVGLLGLGLIGGIILLFKTSLLIGLGFVGFFGVVGLVTAIQVRKEKKEKERLRKEFDEEFECVFDWEE